MFDYRYFCLAGIKYACPPGTFGWSSGLSTPQCSGPCAPGYYCPRLLNTTAPIHDIILYSQSFHSQHSTLKPEEQPGAPQPPAYQLNWPGRPHLHAAGLGFECGDVSLYCPTGSPYPKVVAGGTAPKLMEKVEYSQHTLIICIKNAYFLIIRCKIML